MFGLSMNSTHDHGPRDSDPNEAVIVNSVITGIAAGVGGFALVSSDSIPELYKIALLMVVGIASAIMMVLQLKKVRSTEQRAFLGVFYAVLMIPSVARAFPHPSLPVPIVAQETLGHFIKVVTYKDANANGLQDGDEEIVSRIPIFVQDSLGRGLSNASSTRDGVTIRVSTVDEPVIVGVCGVYQPHIIPAKENTKSTAFEIRIGISSELLELCQKPTT